jgi:hypothetical protein
MPFILTCGDEGVQINQGTRLAIAGAGLDLPGNDQIVAALQKLLGEKLHLAASAENDWTKQHFQLDTYEQADATMQQQLAAAADRWGVEYVGFIPFADPEELVPGIKAHMVRPQGIHIANKICFTLAGGEQTYNLGQFLISAEWVHAVDKETARTAIAAQVEYYRSLAGGQDLSFITQSEGVLGSDIADKNLKLLQEFGFTV